MKYEKPNYTQVPNKFIDEEMGTLDPCEILILLVIFRMTIGYHRQSAYISYSTLVKKTGLGRSTLIKWVDLMEKEGKIKVIRVQGQTNLYQITYSENCGEKEDDQFTEIGGVHQTDWGGPPDGRVGVHQTDHIKESKRKPKESLSCPAGAGVKNFEGVFASSESSDEQPEKSEPVSKKALPAKESPSKVNKVDQTALYCKITANKCDWTVLEINEAIEIVEAKTEKVNDVFEFIKGIIGNLRKKRASKEKKVAKKPKIQYCRTFTEEEVPEDIEIVSMAEIWERQKKEKEDALSRHKGGKAESDK